MHRRSVPMAGATDGNKSQASSGTRRRPRRTVRKRKPTNKFWKQDLLVLLIQVISYLICVSCSVLLVTKWVFGYNLLNKNSFYDESARRREHDAKLLKDYDSNEERIADQFKLLEPSNIYSVPDSMAHVGDKSDQYAKLRKEFDTKDLPQVEQKLIFETMVMEHTNSDQVSYDIYDCPETPPDGYPFDWTLVDILKAWPPDDTTPRPKIFQGLCVFDYTKDLQKAYNYRKHEVPFVVANDPQVQQAVKRWNYPGYMEKMLGQVKHRAEYSENNHFLYWNNPNPKHKKNKKRAVVNNNPNKPRDNTPNDWKAPTKNLRITYEEWLEHANITDDTQLGPDMPHW